MRKIHFGAAALAAALLSVSPAAAELATRGDIFRIDAAPDCQERQPDTAALPGGGFVTVWVGSPVPGQPAENGRIYARVTGPAGPTGPDLQVSVRETREYAFPAVAVREDGRMMVVWGDALSEVWGRVLDQDGTPLGDEFRIDYPFTGLSQDVIAVPDGFVAAWTDGSRVSLRRYDAAGNPAGPTVDAGAATGFFSTQPYNTYLSLSRLPSGDLTLVWSYNNFFFSSVFSGIHGRVIPLDDFENPDLWTKFEHNRENAAVLGTASGVTGAGDLVVVWRESDSSSANVFGLYSQTFDALGRPLRPASRVDDGSWIQLGEPDVSVDAAGGFVAAWAGRRSALAFPGPTAIYARAFGADGEPQGAIVEVAPISGRGRQEPSLVRPVTQGTLSPPSPPVILDPIVVWQEGEVSPPLAPLQCYSSGIAARRLAPGCLPGSGRLCLGDGRFQLETTWSLPSGSGPGHAVPLTRDTGYFWFFDPENVELMVKVLDGRALNGKFWVFYGSLSDVAWSLRVTDLETGAVKTYDNPAGQLASRGDTAALPGAAASAGAFEMRAFQVIEVDPEASLVSTPARSSGTCPIPILQPLPVFPGLCLNNADFEVEVQWNDPFNGTSGAGQGVGLTDDSGYFWFFDPANVELVVKVLDGRAVNGKYWVFYGALTNVEYNITVTSTASGAVKTYHNPPFQFRSRADTAAF